LRIIKATVRLERYPTLISFEQVLEAKELSGHLLALKCHGWHNSRIKRELQKLFPGLMERQKISLKKFGGHIKKPRWAKQCSRALGRLGVSVLDYEY
jgi:hypothetical protein